MKFLASIGVLALVSLWAAFAITYQSIVFGTAGTAFMISLIYIWDMD